MCDLGEFLEVRWHIQIDTQGDIIPPKNKIFPLRNSLFGLYVLYSTGTLEYKSAFASEAILFIFAT